MSEELKLILDEIRGLKAETALLRDDMKQMEGSLRDDMKQMEGSLRDDMKQMETSLRQEIQDGDNAIRLILENDIRPQIQILAENHLELNRKLDEIQKELKKNELLPVRVSLLEKDVREIRHQLSMTV